MAFGTGEHATTASCLRMLCDELPRLPENFSAADLGCGSGILGLAAKALGAGPVEALDNDPAAIRTTKENARLNRLRGLTIRRASVLDWTPALRPDIILANLYSELLMAAAPRIAKALAPGSPLIFSGVLNRQADEVTAALVKNHLTIERIVRRGKWCAGLARRIP
jgi:ribosomal protein L11 methyltransferase